MRNQNMHDFIQGYYGNELDKLRTEFFANLRHEFGTPLNIIFSSIQLLQHKCKICSNKNCNECLPNYLEIINKNSLRILKLSNNYLDLTMIKSGCMGLNKRNQDIISFIKTICNSAINHILRDDINIIFETNIEEKIIAFDSNKVERIMLNLISNSIKFNMGNVKIIISILEIDGYIQIDVKDNGVGIEKCNMQFILDEFSGIYNRLTKCGEGSGVGLSLVKSLVEIQGGSIYIDSEIGKGTHVMFTIPNDINDSEEKDNSYLIIDNNSFKAIEMEFSDLN